MMNGSKINVDESLTQTGGGNSSENAGARTKTTHRDGPKLKIDDFTKHFPPHLRDDGFWDITILHGQRDLVGKEGLQEFIENVIQTLQLPENRPLRIKLYEEHKDVEALFATGYNDYITEETLRRTTFVFLFIDRHFIKDWPEISGNKAIRDLLYNKERKWSLIPVYTMSSEDLKINKLAIPMGLDALTPLHYYRNDNVYRTVLRRLVNQKLDVRLEAEKEHRKKQQEWIRNNYTRLTREDLSGDCDLSSGQRSTKSDCSQTNIYIYESGTVVIGKNNVVIERLLETASNSSNAEDEENDEGTPRTVRETSVDSGRASAESEFSMQPCFERNDVSRDGGTSVPHNPKKYSGELHSSYKQYSKGTGRPKPTTLTHDAEIEDDDLDDTEDDISLSSDTSLTMEKQLVFLDEHETKEKNSLKDTNKKANLSYNLKPHSESKRLDFEELLAKSTTSEGYSLSNKYHGEQVQIDKSATSYERNLRKVTASIPPQQSHDDDDTEDETQLKTPHEEVQGFKSGYLSVKSNGPVEVSSLNFSGIPFRDRCSPSEDRCSISVGRCSRGETSDLVDNYTSRGSSELSDDKCESSLESHVSEEVVSRGPIQLNINLAEIRDNFELETDSENPARCNITSLPLSSSNSPCGGERTRNGHGSSQYNVAHLSEKPNIPSGKPRSETSSTNVNINKQQHYKDKNIAKPTACVKPLSRHKVL